MSVQTGANTLGDALPGEIMRCVHLLEICATIPTGGFMAAMIKQDMERTLKAMVEQDLPGMIAGYKALQGYKE